MSLIQAASIRKPALVKLNDIINTATTTPIYIKTLLPGVVFIPVLKEITSNSRINRLTIKHSIFSLNSLILDPSLVTCRNFAAIESSLKKLFDEEVL